MCWGTGTGVGPGASFLLYPPRPETRPTEVRRLRDPSAGEDGREHLGAHHLRLPHHRLHDPLLVRGPDHEVRGKGCRRHGHSKSNPKIHKDSGLGLVHVVPKFLRVVACHVMSSPGNTT